MKPGTCRLCGKRQMKLTKDHSPPQCASNEKSRGHYRRANLYTQTLGLTTAVGTRLACGSGYDIAPEQPPIRGGISEYSQCSECNNLLSRNYDVPFGDWCRTAKATLQPGRVLIVQERYLQMCQNPLAVLKRVIALFFSINGDCFAERNQELAKFVLDPASRQLPEPFGIFAAFCVSDLVSYIPVQCRLNVANGHGLWISQISYPPFTFALTLDGQCPDRRFFPLRSFAQHSIGKEANAEVVLSILPTNPVFAGDYRGSGRLVPDNTVVLTTELPPRYFRLVDTVF